MSQLKTYTFTSNKNEKYVLVGTSYDFIIERFKRESPFFIGSIKSMDVEPITGLEDIAVIDMSTCTLHLLSVPLEYDSEQTNAYLSNNGFKLSEISWGVISEVIDERVNPAE